jgi:hypothetical protein
MKSAFDEAAHARSLKAARGRLILMETPCVVRAID